MKINFGKFSWTELVEKTRGNLCSKRFGVALIKLRSNCWTPNSGQKFRCSSSSSRVTLASKSSMVTGGSLSGPSSPRSLSTCRASSQKTTANALLPLLLVGITKSTPANSLSVLHKATIGIPTFDASLTACASALGSHTRMISGSILL